MAKSDQQKEVEEFIKEFFKTAPNSGIWKDEESFDVNEGDYLRFVADGFNEDLEIVWEYDGPKHYTDEITIEKDKKRNAFFLRKRYKLIIIPYFCLFNKAVTRHYLKPAFENEKDFEEAMTKNYNTAYKVAYKAAGDCYPRPGWHGSRHTPFKFSEGGMKRFLKELDELPEETQHQIIHSLKPVLARVIKKTLNKPSNKILIEKIRNSKVKDEHIKNWCSHQLISAPIRVPL